MSELDTSVTGEELEREDGTITRLKTKHFAGTHRYWVVIEQSDGEAKIQSYSPILVDGRPVTQEKLSVGEMFASSGTVPMANWQNTIQLIASAARYARKIYDIDVGRAVYIDQLAENGVS